VTVVGRWEDDTWPGFSHTEWVSLWRLGEVVWRLWSGL
jgi:hypothetical protein